MDTGPAIMVAGGALLAGTWWPLLFRPFAQLVVNQPAIEPEESYLGERYRLGCVGGSEPSSEWRPHQTHRRHRGNRAVGGQGGAAAHG